MRRRRQYIVVRRGAEDEGNAVIVFNANWNSNFNYGFVWLAIGWGLVLFILLVSFLPMSARSLTVYDKVNHFLSYAILMAWFTQLFPQRKSQFVYMLAFALMGIAVEFIQGLTAYRSFELADMLANSLGLLAGWAFSAAIMVGWLVKLDHRIGGT